MTVVASFDAVEWRGGGRNHRDSNSRSATLLEGDPSSPNNYWLAIVRMGDQGGSPRHRHDFDQVRYPLEGAHPYSPKEEVPPGWVGYFPEGVPYGPFDQVDGREYLILQCGGASGCGYLSRDGWRQATAELSERGQFRKGFYEYDSGGGVIRRKDALEAVLEHARARPVVYPAGRYKAPVVLNPEAFGWTEVAETPGVQVRQLMTFNERRSGVGQVRLAPQKSYEIPPDDRIRLFFMAKGSAAVAGSSIGPRSAFSVEPGETGIRITSKERAEGTELLVLFLPHLPRDQKGQTTLP